MCYLYKCEQAAVQHVSKYQSYTLILTISNGMNMSLFPPCFSVLQMYIQVFPMKTSRLSRYEQHVWKINGKEIEYLWVKENLNVLKQKSHIIIFHMLCDMGLPCLKFINSNPIKDRDIIFAVSKRYINFL